MHKQRAGLWLSLALGCGDAGPSGVEKTAPAAQAPVPPHDFDRGPGPAVHKTTPGSLGVTLDGDPITFSHFPYGANAIVLADGEGVSRATISAQGAEGGYPRVQLYISGVRVDSLEFPARLETARSDNRIVEVRLQRSETSSYTSAPGQAVIVVERFDGARLSGAFEGILAAVGTGAPARVAQGNFDVQVRVRGQSAPAGD